MTSSPSFLGRLTRATLVQAARSVEQLARRDGRDAEIGRDVYPTEEAIHFIASDRMTLVTNDLADASDDGDQIRMTANILGLAGASPALPPAYSELQLERRRARDLSFSRFLNLFDHRALSFFYRIARKFHWPLLAERAGKGEPDPVAGIAVALAGFGTSGVKTRLDIADAALVPLVAHLGDSRRSASSVQTVLQLLTGLPLRIEQATPVWMPVPPAEQTRLGTLGGGGQFARLGCGDDEPGMGMSEAALIGAAILDVQHHYLIEIGPVSYGQLQNFCGGSDARRIVSQLCALVAGIEHRPSIRMLIDAEEVPPLTLGNAQAPALLGWTTWLGKGEQRAILDDCVIPLDNKAVY